MKLSRRDFLLTAGAAASVAPLSALTGCAQPSETNGWSRRRGRDEWSRVRERIPVSPDYVHLAGLLLASHPVPVADAIAAHRAGLDENPPLYLDEHRRNLERETRRAAAEYLGGDSGDIALTDSTTMGIALVYNGLSIRPDQEMLVSRQDYYSTRESLRYRAGRSAARLREISLYRRVEEVSADEIVSSVIGAVNAETRVVAATWVHSSTGLKFPVRGVAEQLSRVNAGRAPDDRVLLCVDGVHALGVEDFRIGDLGCDFFMAGTHKWLFGPRGTGILWGNPATRDALSPTIPTFTRDGTWGGLMSPGGFKSFEHQWALAEAFRFHLELGKDRVQERVHQLASQAKEGLRRMSHVRLYTPLSPELSAGIVCFDVEGMRPGQVVGRLLQRRVIASVTPYTPSHARVTPGLLNTPDEVDYMLAAVAELA